MSEIRSDSATGGKGVTSGVTNNGAVSDVKRACVLPDRASVIGGVATERGVSQADTCRIVDASALGRRGVTDECAVSNSHCPAGAVDTTSIVSCVTSECAVGHIDHAGTAVDTAAELNGSGPVRRCR